MNRSKLQLSDLNPHLMCVLCGGYYIDATTIVECLHSFCRSCIVKHLESSKYCPICEVQVHKTKPLINIRPDKTLQDIVYKLVPGLFASEMRNRRKFYRERPHYMKPNDSESVGEVPDDAKVYVNDENITFSLDYHTSTKQQGCLENSFHEISMPIMSEKRYFKCPTGVTIYHLQKLLKAKYDLNDNNYKVEIFYKDQPLHEDFTLLDIAYIYLWKNNGTFDLTFKIYESVVKRQKIEETVKKEPVLEEKKQPDVRLEIPLTAVKTEEPEPCRDNPMEGVVEAADPVKVVESQSSEGSAAAESVKENGVVASAATTAAASKEVQLQISESGVMSVSQVENGEVVRTVEEKPPAKDSFRNKTNASGGGSAMMPAATTTTVTVPGKVVTTTATTTVASTAMPGKTEPTRSLIRDQPAPKHTQSKPAKSYKTIQCPPNTWNPVIPKEKLRPTLMKNSDEPKKPLKFFKMRNMPRFLGNPASGVKPMYAESSAATDAPAEERRDNAKAIKNILKIDPKTLRPIEKEDMPVITAPSTPNLLTNPFIPNNNHFLFSDPALLHPNAGHYSNLSKSEKHNNNNTTSTNHNTNSNTVSSSSSGNSSNYSNNSSSSGSNNSNNNSNGKPSGSSRPPIQNGTFQPPICFPTPDFCSNYFPYQSNFSKHPSFYPPASDKIDPLIRASRLSPFPNIPAFNVAGFHASLPPSISLLLKHQTPHHHHKKVPAATTTTTTGHQYAEKKTVATPTSVTTTTTTATVGGVTTKMTVATTAGTTVTTAVTTTTTSSTTATTTTTTKATATKATVTTTVSSQKDESTKTEKDNKNCDDNSLKISVTSDKKKVEESKADTVTAAAAATATTVNNDGSKEQPQEKTQEKKEGTENEENTKKESEAKKAETESQESVTVENKESQDKTIAPTAVTSKAAAPAAEKEGNNDKKDGASGDEIAAKPQGERSTCQDETSACNAEAKPHTVDNNNDNKSINDKER